MTVKKDAFAVIDCKNDGWMDASTLEPHLLRSGQQRKFVFYVYDADSNKGVVAVSETPVEAVDKICRDRFIIPTVIVVFMFALNIEQTEMVNTSIGDGDIDIGISSDIKPDEFIKNIVNLFGGMITTIVDLRDSAPADAKVSYSCDGTICSANISGKPDVSGVGDLLNVNGVVKEDLVTHIRECLDDDTEEVPMCASKHPMFVQVNEDGFDDDYAEKGSVELIGELCKLKLAVHVSQESEAYNNHQMLMLSSIVIEGDLQKAIEDGKVFTHLVEKLPDGIMAHMSAGSMNFALALKRPEVKVPPLLTPNFFIETFNSTFKDEEPTDLEEVDVAMEWCGMIHHYDFYPDDPHMMCVVSGKMTTAVFLTRNKEGKYIDANIGYFLTPVGFVELLKTVVKLRFYEESRHCLDAMNSAKRDSEMHVLIDRYSRSFGDALGDYLGEVVEFASDGNEFDFVSKKDVTEKDIDAMSADEFNQFLVEQGINDNEAFRDSVIENVLDCHRNVDFDDIDCISALPK